MLQSDPGEPLCQRRGPRRHQRKTADFLWKTHMYSVVHIIKGNSVVKRDFKMGKCLRLKTERNVLWGLEDKNLLHSLIPL